MKKLMLLLSQHWFATVLIASAAALSWQNLSLSRMNRDLRLRVDYVLGAHVSVGDHLGELRGMTMGGKQITKSAIGRTFGTLLIAMSANCGICAKNLASWDRLTTHAVSSGVNVIWVSRDPIERIVEFAKTNSVDPSVIADPTYWTWMQLKLGAVPQTIVADATGVVRHIHAGEIDGPMEAALTSAVDAVAPAARAAAQREQQRK